MQRVTVTLDDDLMAELDAIIAERGYQNRSEAIRDLARAGIKEAAPDSGRGRDCVAALVYVYDHEARQLSKRLVRAFTISTSCRSPRCMCISTMTLASRSRCCAASRARCSISASTSSPSAACVTASWCACRSKLPPLRVEAAIVRIIIITIMTRWRPSPPSGDPRMLSGRCLPMARSSGPRMTSGKSSPGSGPSIASKILHDFDGNAGIRSLPRSQPHKARLKRRRECALRFRRLVI